MTDLVQYQCDDKVATITLNNGKVNALSHEMIDALNAALDKAIVDKAVVVIKGQLGMFSAGYDLTVMQESMDAAMKLVEKGSTLTRRMLSFDYPIIAACTGHAVAKGAFVLLASDFRIGIQGKFKIGLNEVAIGMTMHQAGLELARGRLAPVFFNRSVILAEMLSVDDAVTAGFLDVAVAPEAFEQTVTAAAQAMTKLNMKAHKQTKLKARAGLLDALDKAIEVDRGSSL
ncbi:putative enoyl-CoA hydratase [Paraglaciecola mesophila]|uniref:Putative enoyl-CoA hydratase n=1 Tax=Paraglaciecola mesophila TaxID=197222 RepID=A0A857JLB3_9ALTE|nr:crotonase/enoyl-CoA hydratase family protein [Paraglaciecola mesophila]QHJ11757.1 putative enoyl-CoA hydratase [Paraglaciecola mesophila]